MSTGVVSSGLAYLSWNISPAAVLSNKEENVDSFYLSGNFNLYANSGKFPFCCGNLRELRKQMTRWYCPETQELPDCSLFELILKAIE